MQEDSIKKKCSNYWQLADFVELPRRSAWQQGEYSFGAGTGGRGGGTTKKEL